MPKCDFNKVAKQHLWMAASAYYICNRCLYKRSVIVFVEDKYCIDNHNFCDNLIQSFGESFYVCLTYHKKLLKKQIPCQSVSNKPSRHKDVAKTS